MFCQFLDNRLSSPRTKLYDIDFWALVLCICTKDSTNGCHSVNYVCLQEFDSSELCIPDIQMSMRSIGDSHDLYLTVILHIFVQL